MAVQIDREISAAETLIADVRFNDAFHHLERARVLGQASTYDHTRIHWRMFKLGLKMRSLREIFGQLLRIAGAATKTPLRHLSQGQHRPG